MATETPEDAVIEPSEEGILQSEKVEELEVSSESVSDLLQETDEVPDSSTWTPAKPSSASVEEIGSEDETDPTNLQTGSIDDDLSVETEMEEVYNVEQSLQAGDWKHLGEEDPDIKI